MLTMDHVELDTFDVSIGDAISILEAELKGLLEWRTPYNSPFDEEDGVFRVDANPAWAVSPYCDSVIRLVFRPNGYEGRPAVVALRQAGNSFQEVAVLATWKKDLF